MAPPSRPTSPRRATGTTTWLQQQPLASRTRASYLAQVRQYLQWLGTLDDSDELLPDHTRGSAHIGWGPAARSYEQRKEADLVSGQEAGFWWILLTVLAITEIHSY